MRNAPSVIYPVGRCFFYAGLLCMLAVLSLLVLLWWIWLGADGQVPRMASWFGAVLWLAWAGFAWRSWVHAPVGLLQWDALATPPNELSRDGMWRWQRDKHSDGAPLQQVERVLDLQSRLLLRVRNPDGAHRWLWVEQFSDPSRWNGLRRALFQAS
ncbi:MAG: hypothetical protein U1D25_01360 [Hydrogenophaga sp.]|uniref:hypothetical protein n=1 Tax=Hydrogenophaga sp. TaxID=1904254 RepID=UPI0027476032|nr:hypothetical protein [Hydrogenophaga sp.]MDP2416678.1 hypothetical protein [Hydrogenophaga sp.]MDZ4186743.1 hypothetical protein [Hydrogenophaga sp.]